MKTFFLLFIGFHLCDLWLGLPQPKILATPMLVSNKVNHFPGFNKKIMLWKTNVAPTPAKWQAKTTKQGQTEKQH